MKTYDHGAMPSTLKVLFLVDTLERGGTETHMVQLAVRLKAKGHRIIVGCLHPGGALAENLCKAGVPVVEFPKLGSLLSFRGAYQILRLTRYIRRERFDVIHAHDLWANLMGITSAYMAGTEVIISSQRDLGHLWWYTPFRNRVLRAIHLLANRVIANSAAVRDMLVKDFRIPPDHVQIVRNGVDIERFESVGADRRRVSSRLDDKERLVIVVANMHSELKGHYELIEAARRICREVPKARFVLVGDGEERTKIEQHVRDAGLLAHFLFLGSRKDIPELLACAEVSILPSRAEGLPNAILEAMAAGVPVVATRVGGIPEIVEDGECGLLVPSQDPQALAESTLRLLQDSGLAARIARNALERIRARFSFDHVVCEFEEVYRSNRLSRSEKFRNSEGRQQDLAVSPMGTLSAMDKQTGKSLHEAE
jgi:L-malate glycosyltransferase